MYFTVVGPPAVGASRGFTRLPRVDPRVADDTAAEPEADAESADGPTRVLYLATWERRFFAWLVDVIIVGVVVGAVGDVVAALPGPASPAPATGFGGLGLFVYWTLLEGRTGQSAGKLVLDLRVVDEAGDEIDYVTAAIESFGKAFLLPVDCLVGWLAMPGEKVRLFNRLSETVVVKAEDEGPPEGVEYVVPEE